MKKNVIFWSLALVLVAAGFAVAQGELVPAIYFSRAGSNDADVTVQRAETSGTAELQILLSTSDTETYAFTPTGIEYLGGADVLPGEFTASKSYGETVADHLSTKFFIATRSYKVLDIDAVWTTAESTGAMDVMVERLQGTEACGSGDDLQTAAIDATGTAETVNAATLTATTALLTLAAGDRLCVTLTATPNEVKGLTVSVRLQPQ